MPDPTPRPQPANTDRPGREPVPMADATLRLCDVADGVTAENVTREDVRRA